MLHLIISTQSFVFLMLASFLAGFLDAIAGGGGLITIPAYLSSGLPVHMVYACNKFASSCGTAIATLRYYRNKMVDIPVGLLAAAGAFVCSAIAAKIVLVQDVVDEVCLADARLALNQRAALVAFKARAVAQRYELVQHRVLADALLVAADLELVGRGVPRVDDLIVECGGLLERGDAEFVG